MMSLVVCLHTSSSIELSNHKCCKYVLNVLFTYVISCLLLMHLFSQGFAYAFVCSVVTFVFCLRDLRCCVFVYSCIVVCACDDLTMIVLRVFLFACRGIGLHVHARLALEITMNRSHETFQ